MVKNSPDNVEDAGDSFQSLCWEDPLEKEMSTHSSILAWRIPWAEESDGLHTVHGVEMSQTTERLSRNMS